MRTLIIGSRASRLALLQAGWVREWIESLGRPARIQVIRTSPDLLRDRPLATFGGKGIVVREIEDALLGGSIDLAVHSLKDLPTAQPAGLRIACFPRREDPRDLLVSRDGSGIAGLGPGAVLGTGSPRRACQIRALRPDLTIRDLRGNVDTRLRKVERGDYDAIVLAVAGIRRLNAPVRGTPFDLDEMIPAVGQGALAVEIRSGDGELAALLAGLHDPPTAAAVEAERAFLRGLGGGCQAPIAAIGVTEGDRLTLRGLVGDLGSGRILRGRREGSSGDPERLGGALAESLLRRGAEEIVRRAPAPPADAP
ncbi:MAG: hydroxymethylbilane synthase [Acidobacteriota bacterium]